MNWYQYPIRLILGLILVLGLSLVGYRTFFPDLPLVGIINWTEHIKGFEASQQGVIEGLREEGFQKDLNIRLAVKNAHGNRDLARTISRDFQKEGARILITLGTLPTLIALDATTIPVVYAAVAAPGATGLSRATSPHRQRFTGTSMEVPIKEQLEYLLLARPGCRRLGILYCDATPPAVAKGEEAARVSLKMGLTPILRSVADDRPELINMVLTELLNRKIEALFIPTDPVLGQPQNLQIICGRTNRARVPVMVSNGYTVVYGPLLAYSCDLIGAGRQAGRQAALLLNGVPIAQVPPESPNITRLTINLKTAQDLGLQLPRRLLSQAYQFFQ